VAWGECSCHGYKKKYCPGKAKEGKRASGDKLKDQMKPLVEPRSRGGRKADDKAHRQRCHDQGYRGLSTW
jgi:hypothetical protein